MIVADVNSNFVASNGQTLKDRAMARLAEFYDDYTNVEALSEDITKVLDARTRAESMGCTKEELAAIASGINLRTQKLMETQKEIMDKYGLSYLHVKVLAKGLVKVLEAA